MIFFALIKLIPITLTLPGIAGLVLTIGVTADSNIVIFERIKEEVRAGRSMSSAISAGYRRGIATIIDANVVTLLTAFVLFVLATAGVKGFAFVLGVGTIVSLLTAVVFTQALLGAMSRSRLLRSPSALGATKEGIRWHFDFMGASRWFFTDLRRDPAGRRPGAGDEAAQPRHRLQVGHPGRSGAGQADRRGSGARTLDSAGISGGEVQKVSNPGLGDNAFLIQSKTLEPGQINKLQKELEKEYGIQANGFNSTSVGPTFGATVANSARNALIFSLLIICAYIAFRFDPKFAVPVLIAIFHDILITAGIYSLTGREVSSGTVAAFLTILGYSLYDTIIVFDRIRENMPRMPRAAFSQIVNRSMSEVLTRSLATSFTTLLSVGRAADLRRRHPAGLRLRDDGRDRLRYLLVDLHRLAGADRLEGTRAGLHPPPRADRRDRRQRAGLRRRRRSGDARRRRRDRRRDRGGGRGAARGAAQGRRRGDRRAAAEGEGGEPVQQRRAARRRSGRAAARRERDEKRRARRQQRRKHGRKR